MSLPERAIGTTLFVMFKFDHLSMIMLSVNVGVPLLFLVAVVVLFFRQMIPA